MGILKKRIHFLHRSLWKIKDEIEMCYGESDYSENLEELITEIGNQSSKFEDYWWKCKERPS